MEQNSIIEVGSKANVILRFNIETTLNNVTYAENEPYLFLKDCRVVINYSQQNKTGRTDKTVIANSDVKPRNVVIGDIVFSRKIAGLLSTLVNEGQSYDKSVFDSAVAYNNIIYLTKTINYTLSYFTYDSNFDIVNSSNTLEDADNKITISLDTIDVENLIAGKEYRILTAGDTDFTLVGASDSVVGTIFTATGFGAGTGTVTPGNGEYIVSYSSVVTGTKFNLIKTHVPYMSIEVQGEGNIDKESKNVVMYFGRVSLESVIDFTFIQNSMLNVPLSFHIIDDTDNYVVYED